VLLVDGRSDSITYDPTGPASVTRKDASGQVIGRFSVGGDGAPGGGEVVSVDPAKSQIVVKSDRAEDFVGRVVHFRNDLRRTAHTVVSASQQGDRAVLTTADDLLVGRARVDQVGEQSLKTNTALFLAPIYRGVTLGSASYEPLGRVREVKDGNISLTAPIHTSATRVSAGDEVWFIDVGPSDRFELPAVVDDSEAANHRNH
jgi:hypothetical protein